MASETDLRGDHGGFATPDNWHWLGGTSPSSCRPLHEADSDVGPWPRQLLFGGMEARVRWADNRASGWFPTKGVGRGRAPGSEAARQRARTLTAVCLRPGCDALVTMARARQQARAAGRHLLAPGDGCASQTCSRSWRPQRFKRAQRATADAIERGERLLVCWPADASDRDVWVHSPTTARRAAAAAQALVR